MPITQTLRMAIAECLEAFPGIQALDGRKALVAQAELDAELAKRITYGGSVHSFCSLLVYDLEEYGALEDGYHPLQAIVDAVHESVDGDARRECDLILADLKFQLAVAGVGELIRSRWYVLLSGLAIGAILLIAIGYVLPVVGQSALGPLPSNEVSATGQEILAPTRIEAAIGETTIQAIEPPVPTISPTVVPTSPATTMPTVATPTVQQPSPTNQVATTATSHPSATVLATESLPTATSRPSQTSAIDTTVLVVLSPSKTPTSVPTTIRLASPTTAPQVRSTRPTPLPTSGAASASDGVERVVKVDAPAGAWRDIQGNVTFNGLAIECLDAASAPIVDGQGFPVLVPLQGTEGTYVLPAKTKKVLLWLDAKIYGDWWNLFSTQAEPVGEDLTIVLSVSQRSGPVPAKGLPDRRRKTPS